MAYADLSRAQLNEVLSDLTAQYEALKAKDLSLNMARGKPSAAQLELALGVLEALKARSEFANSNGDDCRNYGVWDGLPEMKKIFSDMIGVPASATTAARRGAASIRSNSSVRCRAMTAISASRNTMASR